MALTKVSTDGVKDDAVTTDKLANAINTERTANTAKVSTTINNNADNRVITGSGTANTLNAESNVIVDGSGNLGVNTTAPVEKFGVAGNMRFVNPTGTTRRINALPSGGYNVGTTGGSAIAFHRISDGAGGSDEIAFETHWQGNRHGESARISKFGGITFNGDTAAANALDDYEEGTWTPNIRNDGATSTWTTQQGRYVKIGQQVTVWFNADGGSTPRSGGGSGALIMTGLPFSQVMFGNPILGIIGANDNASGGLYSTAGLILNIFGQGGTQVRFGVGGQSANFGINYVAGCFTYTMS